MHYDVVTVLLCFWPFVDAYLLRYDGYLFCVGTQGRSTRSFLGYVHRTPTYEFAVLRKARRQDVLARRQGYDRVSMRTRASCHESSYNP